MARKTVIQLIDDIDGAPLLMERDGEGPSHLTSLPSRSTSATHATQDYRKRSRGHHCRPPCRTQVQRRCGSHADEKTELTKIREWARQNGKEVPDRGRVSSTKRDAYDAADQGGICSPDSICGDPDSALPTRDAKEAADQLRSCRTRLSTTRSDALRRD
ncbi:hypothetical protein DZF92_02440 [Clavibacter michiganensis subsp. insidiosus]|uniref:Lsr2 DNA-binding domain-containing protein n=3 Tax=Clavibacter michiganensis TaxID=28447 RepID=A0A399SSP4_9MICO|nr:hypothetical protein B5P21_15070 [Clavibacter michiganensis subsp. insidiosus]RII88590.1 hypothetical protein DZF92_02440 [Clavibacter michiganensis subsp. insidiosus]RIJ44895.1 hypothetical protein DZF93_01055 [Clavibacter michiganensis subsp. insidiosus]RMC85772.1 hypothetical protein CmiCFBP2404_06580 [Clavibacter michiganensis subsp. insidiosus]